MPAPGHQPLPDIAVGHHPDFGIVAANPKHLAASAWMLKGFDFHPVPGHPDLYALAHQERDGQDRATRAVALLRKAKYQVDADAAFDPLLDPDPSAARDHPIRVEPVRVPPDVAFAEHPQLGMVAATTEGVPLGHQLLDEHGWQPHPHLDIYTLPPAAARAEALGAVARTTVAMNRAGLQVGVQPHLAQDIAARRAPDATASRPERGQGSAIRAFTVMAASARPARAGLPVKPPVPDPAAAPAARPADPRIAFSRAR